MMRSKPMKLRWGRQSEYMTDQNRIAAAIIILATLASISYLAWLVVELMAA